MRGAEAASARGDLESLSQAAGSIRRALVCVADAVEPAGAEQPDHNGKQISCDQSAYKNRLVVFFKRTRGGAAGLAVSELDLQAKRLSRLISRLGKGVHSDLSGEEVRQLYCAVWGLIAEVALASAAA